MHMLPSAVQNYIGEIARILTPQGTCALTTFLLDRGLHGPGISFPHAYGHYHVAQASLHEKAVGYYLNFFREEFAKHQMALVGAPKYGDWLGRTTQPSTGFRHDMLIFTR